MIKIIPKCLQHTSTIFCFQSLCSSRKYPYPSWGLRLVLKGEVVSKAEMMERGRLRGGERTKKVYKFGFDIFWKKLSLSRQTNKWAWMPQLQYQTTEENSSATVSMSFDLFLRLVVVLTSYTSMRKQCNKNYSSTFLPERKIRML